MINILILLGKTCAGKDTFVRELINKGYRNVASYTTRPMRDGEVDGVTYKFISKDDFLDLKENGFFAETTSYNVATGETWYYGISIEDLSNADEKSVVILNPEGLKKVKQIEGLNIISFYIDVKKSIIKKRLRKRGDNRKEARRRLQADKKDFKEIENEVNYTISNNRADTFESQVYLIDYIYKRHMKLKLR